MAESRPVLVTGSNRSGTTWVGQMLCGSGELEYLHEPFNPDIWPRLLDVRLGGHYTYVGPENDAGFVQPMADVLRYRFAVRSHLREVRSPKMAAKVAREQVRAVQRRRRSRRPLLKDPIALFASEWLADRFDAQVVIMIRHPAAFASSIKRLAWPFNFGYLLQQPALLERYLSPWRAEIEAYAAHRPSPFEQSILLWRLFYGTVLQLKERRPDFSFVRHEDLADDPVTGYAALYDALGLHFDDAARRRIVDWSAEGNVTEVASHELGTTRRDSRAAARTWRHRLTPEEVARVREGVADVAPAFYGDETWLEAAG